MIRLLMLDFDQRLVAAVTRALSQEGVEVSGVSSVDEALRRAGREPFDAALLDGDLISVGELSGFGELPLILSTSFLEPEGDHRFFRRARLLRKPFTSAQLLSALHETCRALSPEPASLLDLLRRANSDGLSLAVQVGEALLFVEEGELVHAEWAGVTGERALAEVLAQSGAAPTTLPARKVGRTIYRPFQALLLDLLRCIEEREQRAPDDARADDVRSSYKGPRT